MDRWGQLNLQQKNQLLGIYASKGYTDLASIINHYNTFQAGGRLTFNEWKSQMQSKYPDIEMDNNRAGYDYNAYFNNNYNAAIAQLTNLQHFPDTYKLPNHQTFSNESIYHNYPTGNIGGKWVYSKPWETRWGGRDVFIPSSANFRNHPEIYKESRPYTEREIYKPRFVQSSEQYYDRDNDIIYASDITGEGYRHEYFHARPDYNLLNSLRPYYENLNDERLLQLGADLPFVKRFENDPNHFYSPEEISARVSAARYMLNKAGINNIDTDFLRNARQNELQYGDNFRDLLHMYNDENLLQILNTQYNKGGRLYQEGGPVNNKSDWAKAHEAELALQQLGWNNPDNKLHSDYAAKDSNGYYAGYNLKPVTIAAKHPLWDLPDYQGKEDNPNINTYKDELYQNRKRREEAGKEYLKNIGSIGLAIGTLPMLSYGAVAVPLVTGLGLAGGEGLNYGINKLTPYTSWGNMLAKGIFNTNNELAQTALEFTNPGFLLGPKAAPFVNNQYRGLRAVNNEQIIPSIKRTWNNIVGYKDIPLDDKSLYRALNHKSAKDFKTTGVLRTTAPDDLLNFARKPKTGWGDYLILQVPENTANWMNSYTARTVLSDLKTIKNPSRAGRDIDVQKEAVRIAKDRIKSIFDEGIYLDSEKINKAYSVSPMIGDKTNNLVFPNINVWKKNKLGRWHKTFSTGGSLGKITPLGQWQYPHQVTTIPSNNITMKGVNYPVIGVSDTGDTKYMLPNMDYLFDGNYVTEYPLFKH